jgi:hypothetical protein
LLDSAVRYAGGDRSKVLVLSIPDYAYTPFGQQSGDPAEISDLYPSFPSLARQMQDELLQKVEDVNRQYHGAV